ncbi:DUF2254 domain-containing protein [Halobacillus litoralis]|uniref:DUF2254 domain-containing protein n=1 Tax=Halobacillus litoralis TaxID=45668 RepID=UPI001CD4B785|nr:DUF2254 domain-containing protein [Halobacillus litoralis]MCA0972581.1 DUF2254 domain-containing protein [Halobacillus litoralis]
MAIWYMPAVYISLAIVLAGIVLYLDQGFELYPHVPSFLQINSDSTRILVSTLIGGILTLSAFTLNSLLVVLTTFSGQFSPRMLLNFVSDKRTQHALGIFNGSFVFVLVVFLFIGNSSEEFFVAIPFMTILLAFISALTFIYFINHATMWMQVHNITYTMKKTSEEIINQTLSKELETYRTMDAGDTKEIERENAISVDSVKSGYLQLVDYRTMVAEAKKDDVIVQLHSQIGDYTLKGNNLISYWGPGAEKVDAMKYCRMLEIGHKETEIQDIQMGMHKLAEIAIKSIGNDDPKTAINTIHRMAELMLTVEDYITFTPYLMDEDEQVRVILLEESFDYYIYRGFGFIRHYAKDNHLIITELLNSLAKIAESIDDSKHEPLWRFACQTVKHMDTTSLYELDQRFLVSALKKLAVQTDEMEEFENLKKKFSPL